MLYLLFIGRCLFWDYAISLARTQYISILISVRSVFSCPSEFVLPRKLGKTGLHENTSPFFAFLELRNSLCHGAHEGREHNKKSWKARPHVTENKRRDGGGLMRRTKEQMWNGDRGWQRAGRKAGKQYRWRFGWRTDSREEDDRQSPGWRR